MSNVRTLRFGIALAALTALGAGASHGALVLSHEFSGATPTNGVVTAQVAVGGSNQAQLYDGGVVLDAPALPVGYREYIRDGYAEFRANGSPFGDPDDRGMQTFGASGGWDDYMGTNTYGSGTISMVVRPKFTSAVTRTSFFWHGASFQGASDNIWIFHSDGSQGPRALMFGNTVDVMLGAPYDWHLHNNDWYFLGVSWRDGPQGGNPTAHLYVRPLSPAGVAATGSSTTTISAFAGMTAPLIIGRRGDVFDESAVSDMALFRLYNNFTDLSGFDTLYAQLIPEPASLTLALTVLPLSFRRRR